MNPTNNETRDSTNPTAKQLPDDKFVVEVTDEERVHDGDGHATARKDEERKKKHDQRGETFLAAFCIVM